MRDAKAAGTVWIGGVGGFRGDMCSEVALTDSALLLQTKMVLFKFWKVK